MVGLDAAPETDRTVALRFGGEDDWVRCQRFLAKLFAASALLAIVPHTASKIGRNLHKPLLSPLEAPISMIGWRPHTFCLSFSHNTISGEVAIRMQCC